MKRTGDKTSSELALRFGAARLCLWRLCGNRACLRARACKGDPRNCMGLLNGWLAAVDAEKRVRGSFAPQEREIKTMEEVRAYLAWHKAIERAAAEEPEESAETKRLREELLRRLMALNKTVAHERREADQE